MNCSSVRCIKYKRLRTLKWNLFNNTIRNASSGLGLWDGHLDNEIRHRIEKYWDSKIFSATPNQMNENNEKYYVLSMFPYPSGPLHMGHVRVYSISDSVNRFHRMTGKNVIHPMGWDAFGLPAENAALERNIDPGEWISKNVESMKKQMKMLGCEFDWDRELSTCSPDYYRWTQELFLKLYDRGLVYQNEAYVNWDPVDQTVLADEQVNHDGKSWRSGAKVEKTLLKQWFVKTTAFAKDLMEGLDDPALKGWRDIIKIQKHWIGNCNGTTIDFKLLSNLPKCPEKLILWTDKLEFIDQVKFVAVSRDHFLAKSQQSNVKDVDSAYLNAKVVNPFTGEEIPIYYSKSIEFPRLREDHLGIPGVSEADAEFCDSVGIKYDKLEDLPDEEREKRRSDLMKDALKQKIGGYSVSANLKDWLISRQRYWGTPIPIVHCKSCGARPVPRDQLPVILPKKSNNERGKIPNLREAVDWLKTTCPDCGGEAVREVDTMDTFVDSSWYFMRYIDTKNNQEMFSKEQASKYLPVDLYIGGKEHAELHLYYARFINYFLHSEGLVPTKEPFKQLLVQGMVMGMSYRVKNSGKYLKKDEVEKQGKNYIEKSTGNPVVAAWEKMSKSKFNGVDPMDMFSEYGADTTRLIILADFSPVSPRNWTSDTFPGILNWQQRLWMSVCQFIKSRKNLSDEERNKIEDSSKELEKDNTDLFNSRNFYIKGVTYNIIGSQQLSVGISKMQGFTNSLRKVSLKCLTHSCDYERALATQIIMLAPLAPRFASELWSGFCSAPYHLDKSQDIQHDKDVLEQKWPLIDDSYILDLFIYTNTYRVGSIKLSQYQMKQLTPVEAANLASEHEAFKKYTHDKSIDDYKFVWTPNADGNIYFKITPLTSGLKIKEEVNN